MYECVVYMYVNTCMQSVWLCNTDIQVSWRTEKRVLGALELEFQMVAILNVSAGN